MLRLDTMAAMPPPPMEAHFYQNYPLKDIPHPHPHDVLCGRGGGTNNHIGNSHWRMLVAANKELYVSLPKKQKMLLSKSIVNAVRSQNPPGRFLQKDSKSERWYDVGDQRATEKTSQALREGAPDIRKKKNTKGEEEDKKTPAPPQSAPIPPQGPPPSAPQPPPQPYYPPTVLNEHGVPATTHPRPVPSHVPTHVPAQIPERVPVHAPRDKVPPFPEPPAELDANGEFSLGSLIITDAEQYRLEQGVSTGSAMYAIDEDTSRMPPPVPVDNLEPAGLSFGTVMSLNTVEPVELDTGGLSYGTMMSATPENVMVGASFGSRMSYVPAAPDAGLEDIGTSFGSLTLDPVERQNLIQSLEGPVPPPPLPPQEEVEAAPTFLKLQKSKGNLLDCSDTESDEEESAANRSSQKSANWQRLKETFEQQQQNPYAQPEGLNIPAFQRDFSQMSAMSDYSDHVIPPPPPPRPPQYHQSPRERSEDEEWKHLEATLLNRGTSLASEEFQVPHQPE